MAAVDVTVETIINRPRSMVAAFAGAPDNAPRWYANIKTVTWVTTPPAVAGSRMTFVAHFLGRRLAYTYEITALVPDRLLTMSTAQGPFPMTTTYTFEDVDDAPGQTRMGLRNHGLPTGFSRLMAPMMASAMRRATTADLARLKALLEASPATPGPD